jgi:transcription antitermination factor NusG
VPLKKEKRKWSDRIKLVVTPLINGYVFVNVTEKNRDEVFKSAGVLNYVRYNGGDAVIREEEINALKSIEEKGYYVEGNFGGDFEKGDLVKIKYGPFKGLYGSVFQKGNEEEFVIQIEGIGYTLRVKVPSEILVKEKKI